MNRRHLVVALVICCLVPIHSSGQGQTVNKSRGIILELSMESETAVLMGLVQPAGRQLSLEQIAAGASNPARGGLLVLLTTRPVL